MNLEHLINKVALSADWEQIRGVHVLLCDLDAFNTAYESQDKTPEDVSQSALISLELDRLIRILKRAANDVLDKTQQP